MSSDREQSPLDRQLEQQRQERQQQQQQSASGPQPLNPQPRPQLRSPQFDQRAPRPQNPLVAQRAPRPLNPQFMQNSQQFDQRAMRPQNPQFNPQFDQCAMRPQNPQFNPQFDQRAMRTPNPQFDQRAMRPLSPLAVQRAPGPLSPQFDQRAMRPLSPLAVQRAPGPLSPQFGQRATRPLSPLAVQRAPGPLSPQFGQRATRPLSPLAVQRASTPQRLSSPQKYLREVFAQNFQERSTAPPPPPTNAERGTEQPFKLVQSQNGSNPLECISGGKRTSSNASNDDANVKSARLENSHGASSEDFTVMEPLFAAEDGLSVLVESNWKVLTKATGLSMLRAAYPVRVAQVERAKHLRILELQNKGVPKTDDQSFVLLEDLASILSDTNFQADSLSLGAFLTEAASVRKALKRKRAVRKPNQEQELLQRSAFRAVYFIFLKYGVVFEEGRHMADKQGDVYALDLWLWMNENKCTRTVHPRFLSETMRDMAHTMFNFNTDTGKFEVQMRIDYRSESTRSQMDEEQFSSNGGASAWAAESSASGASSQWTGEQLAAAPTDVIRDDDLQSMFGDHLGQQTAATPTKGYRDDAAEQFHDHSDTHEGEGGDDRLPAEESTHAFAAQLPAESRLTSLLQFASAMGQGDALLGLLTTWLGQGGTAIPAQPQTQREPEPFRDTRVSLWLVHVVDEDTIVARKAENSIPEIVIVVTEDLAKEFTQILHVQQVQYDGSDKQLCQLLKMLLHEFINKRSEKAEALLNRLCVGTDTKAVDFLLMNACRTEASFVDYAYDLMTCAQGDDGRRSLIALNQFGDCLSCCSGEALKDDQLLRRLGFLKSVLGGSMTALDGLWLPWTLTMLDYLKEVRMLRLDCLPQNLRIKGNLKFMTATDMEV